ncbi:MAG: acyl carrier protein [Myxococcaceae bacterium]|nr:acyl carrier protein [Myxococcaceae bacterium]
MTLSISEIEGAVTRFIAGQFLDGDASELDRTTPLLQAQVLTSLNIVTLITFLETEFKVTVPGIAFKPEHLATIEAIARWVTTLPPA